MGKLRPKSIHAIMTIQTRFTISKNVLDSKPLIHLTVTVRAGLVVESCYIVGMAVNALEWIILRFELVRGKGIS